MKTINERFNSDSIEKIVLSNDTELCIRTLHQHDRENVKQYFSSLSSESKYNRYFTHKSDLSDNELRLCLNPNPNDYYVIGAWEGSAETPERQLVGTASYVHLHDEKKSAEFAIIIADDWQHRGIGKHLVRAVLDAAKRAQIERMLVYFLPSNTGMKKLALSMSENISFKYEEGVVVADFNLEKDKVTTYFWPSDIDTAWNNTFQSIIDTSFIPFTIGMKLFEKQREAMESLNKFNHIDEFEQWLDSVENAWF